MVEVYHVICKYSRSGRDYFTLRHQVERKIISIQFRAKLMVMSSFLMNSSPYVEPKFPPSEEYSQITTYHRNMAKNTIKDRHTVTHTWESHGIATVRKTFPRQLMEDTTVEQGGTTLSESAKA